MPPRYTEEFKIDAVKQELQSIFKKPIDLVPHNNQKLLENIVYV